VENYNRRPAVPGGGPSLASTALRWSIAVAALAYIAYFALLVTCDLWRVEPLGFVPRFESEAVTISDVQPGSIGARAGLQPGDRIKRVNTQILQGAADWQRVRVYLDPSKPLKLEIEHDGRSSTVTLLLSSGLGGWRSGPPRPGLVAFRLAQIITLGFALVVALKCSLQPSALVGTSGVASVFLVRAEAPVPRLMRLKMWHSPAVSGFLTRFHHLQRELVAWAEPGLDPPLAARVDATGCPSVLTEFRQGVPLVDRVRSCQLDPEDAIMHLEPLISLMRRAHARGLVHGSIVPGNIMLRLDSGSAYLLDFGLRARS
jgi:PDZ domain